MTAFLINLIGVALIFFVIVWFWHKQKQKISAKKLTQGPIDILVADGVYQPDTIYVPVKQPIELRFYRKDSTPCAEVVVFEQLNISSSLPLKQKQNIHLTINEPGEYTFTCQMGMYHGRLIAS